VVESIRPELDIKISTNKHGSDGIGNSEVAAFHRSILIGGIGTRGSHIITEAFEEFNHFRVMEELAALVKVHILARTGGGMALKEMPKPVDRCRFGDASVPILSAGEVIGNEDPTGFAIQTNIIFGALCIFGLRTGEREVNREALERLCGSASGVGPCWFFLLLCTNACGALIQDGFHVFKLGDALDMLVGIIEIIVARVSQSLVPQHALGSSPDGIDRGTSLNVLMKWQRVEHSRCRFKFMSELGKLRLLVDEDAEEGSLLTLSSELRVGGNSCTRRCTRSCGWRIQR